MHELAEYAGAYECNEAIAIAFLSGYHTMAVASTADYFGVHYTTVGRLVRRYESVEYVNVIMKDLTPAVL